MLVGVFPTMFRSLGKKDEKADGDGTITVALIKHINLASFSLICCRLNLPAYNFD